MTLIKEGMWNIVTGNENTSEKSRRKSKIFVEKRSCFSNYCAICESNAVVLAWTRPWKSSFSLEKVCISIPEENMGEQIGPTKKVVQFEAESLNLKLNGILSYVGDSSWSKSGSSQARNCHRKIVARRNQIER